jgi:riboflavin kinase / FMN adenylyltransferase
MPHPPAPSLVTIGKFDGVHLGHRHLIAQLKRRACQLGARTCVVTFDRHPFEVLRPDRAPVRLTSTADKLRLLYEAGVDDVWVCPFTRELAQLGAVEFVELIRARWTIREMWVGEGFALGRDRTGSTDVLRQLGLRQGWRLRVVPPALVDGEVVSSSRIRALLAADRHAEAQRLLGHQAA